MKKLFQLFRIQRSALSKKSISGETLDIESANIKTETKTFLALPMTFDFTAYFDDNELENNAENISHENSAADTNTEFFCVNNEKCNEMLYSSNSQHFECCIN
jgi:hypothetical protein